MYACKYFSYGVRKKQHRAGKKNEEMNQDWEAEIGKLYHKTSTLHLVGKLILMELGPAENAEDRHRSEDTRPKEGVTLTQVCTREL